MGEKDEESMNGEKTIFINPGTEGRKYIVGWHISALENSGIIPYNSRITSYILRVSDFCNFLVSTVTDCSIRPIHCTPVTVDFSYEFLKYRHSRIIMTSCH